MDNWLALITNWFKEQFAWMWDALVAFFTWWPVMLMEAMLNGFALLVESIPVPDFIATYSMGALLGQAGTSFAWVFSSLRIGEALAIIGAGYAFRMLRKVFTLFQW